MPVIDTIFRYENTYNIVFIMSIEVPSTENSNFKEFYLYLKHGFVFLFLDMNSFLLSAVLLSAVAQIVTALPGNLLAFDGRQPGKLW